MKKKILMLLLAGAIICTGAGCSRNTTSDESKQIIETQNKLAEYDGVITYQVKTDMKFAVIGDDKTDDFLITSETDSTAKVKDNEVRYIETSSSTDYDGDIEKDDLITWYSSTIHKKYQNSDELEKKTNDNTSSENNKEDISNTENVETTWYMSDLTDFDKITNELPQLVNNNEKLNKLIASALESNKVKKGEDTYSITVTVSMADLYDSGITADLFLRSAFYGADMPESTDENAGGNIVATLEFHQNDNTLKTAKINFDKEAYAYINEQYKDFGLRYDSVDIELSAAYDEDEVLDLPKEITDNAVPVATDNDPELYSEPNTEIDSSTETDMDSENVSVPEISSDKQTFARTYFSSDSVDSVKLLEKAKVNAGFLDDMSTIALVNGQTIYIDNSDILNRLAELVSQCDTTDITSAIDQEPENEEENIREYATNLVALDIISQSNVMDDTLYEEMAKTLFNNYTLLDISDVENCVSENFSAFTSIFH